MYTVLIQTQTECWSMPPKSYHFNKYHNIRTIVLYFNNSNIYLVCCNYNPLDKKKLSLN